MKYNILLTFILSFLFVNTNAQVPDSFDLKIQKMLDLNGSKRNFDLVVAEMMDMQEEAYSSILNEEFFRETRKEMLEDGFNAILVKLIPVYKETFSELEIDGIIAFLESEAGQALTNKTPIILERSMAIGAEWGVELGQRIQDKIKNSNGLKMATTLEEDCSYFKEGNFESMMTIPKEGGTVEMTLKIKREGNIQTESMEGEADVRYQIDWLSNCRYKLSELDSEGKAKKDDFIEVNILEIKGDTFMYIAKMGDSNFYIEGEITKTGN